MGVQLGDIVPRQEITLKDLQGKKIAIDAMNSLYQFLAIIRQPDGTPLKNARGEVTSHLSGLLYRTTNLVEKGIKPVYVFDGEPPKLKHLTIHKRGETRREAMEKWEEALEEGDLEKARTHAQAASRLTPEMVETSKQLLEAMGIPYVQAPSEGEAQAAYMAKKGDTWASASQDYDSLLYATPQLLRNVTITGKRKLPRKNVWVDVSVEKATLNETLEKNGITLEQLVDIAILVGTDYNIGGVKGVGPKKALQLIQKYGCIEEIPPKEGIELGFPAEEIRKIFLKPKVTEDYTIRWGEPDKEKVIEILCVQNNFSRDRVEKAVTRLQEAISESIAQTALSQWF